MSVENKLPRSHPPTRWLALMLLTTSSCVPAAPSGAAPPPSQTSPATESSVEERLTSPPAEPASGEAPSGPATCGELGCLRFDSPGAALDHILDTEPLIIAVGETHALRGTESVEPATVRFRRELLPLLRGRASDLVVELLVPDPACRREAEHAAEVQRPVTERQAMTNQSEFVALGHEAKRLGIRPHALTPSCEELEEIVKAGPDGILEMLVLITRLTADKVRELADQPRQAGVPRMVLAYGGAMHNDRSPRPGREPFSFGPALAEYAGDRYVELDLIVPEFIKDNDAWRALPWYPFFEGATRPAKVVLFNPEPGSYALIFPRSEADAAAAGAAGDGAGER